MEWIAKYLIRDWRRNGTNAITHTGKAAAEEKMSDVGSLPGGVVWSSADGGEAREVAHCFIRRV